MGRQKIRSIRREELIRATITAIHDHGFADLTVAQIARDAQASTGSIHYYFGGKEALLEATMVHLLGLLKTAYHQHLSTATTPQDRLHAVVQANFDQSFLSLETCRVWTQFWAFAPFHPRLARLQKLNRARVRSNLIHALRTLVAEQDQNIKVNAIQGYMDGVWVQLSQSSVEPDFPLLQSEARRFVDQTIT